MKLRISVTLIAMAILSLCPFASGGAKEDEAQIRAALQKWVASFNSGDLKTAAEVWAPDLDGWPPEGGDDTYDREQKYAAMAGGKPPDATYALTINEVIVSCDMALVRDTWTETPAADASKARVFRSFELWRRQPDGAWKIARWIDGPPAPASAAETVPEILRRQTQELFDALIPGTASVWEKYLDADVRYGDENGAVMTKKEMVAGIHTFPKGISGALRLLNFDVVLHGDMAVATYILDEDENYYGAKLHCQYRSCDTWIKTADGWKLLADQTIALRTDPPAMGISSALRTEYCGLYRLSPDVTYEIRCKGESLEGQQSAHKPEELRAEAPDVLFVPGKPRYRMIFQRGKDGRITGFAERREAWDIVWSRMP